MKKKRKKKVIPSSFMGAGAIAECNLVKSLKMSMLITYLDSMSIIQ